MKKALILLAGLILSLFSATVIYAQNVSHYDLVDGDTVIISGTGELKSIYELYEKEKIPKPLRTHIGKKTTTDWEDIKKIVIKNGFTKVLSSVSLSRLDSLEEIIFPDTLTEIQEYSLAGSGNLRKVTFGNNLKKIGEGAFSDNEHLEELLLPDSVTEIDTGAFRGCTRLRKIVVPASLRRWDPGIIKGCPGLRVVANHSDVFCRIPWYKKYVTWKVGKEKVTGIPPGRTGKGIAKKIPIRYDLMGGEVTGKLPEYFRFGEKVTFSNSVKRKGYTFMGWWDIKRFGLVSGIRYGQKKPVKVYATWIKYKVESKKPGKVTVTFDSTEAPGVRFDSHAIRYSFNKNMSSCDIAYSDTNKGKITVRVEPGKTYYFQISGIADGDEEYEIWKGKQKVSVCR